MATDAVQKYFEVHKLTQARLYLTSRRMLTISSSQGVNSNGKKTGKAVEKNIYSKGISSRQGE